jgi:hypothetical protein
MRFITFTAKNFLDLKPHIQGKHCFISVGEHNDIKIGTGYALLKNTLEFERYNFRIEAAYSDTEFIIKGISKQDKS